MRLALVLLLAAAPDADAPPAPFDPLRAEAVAEFPYVSKVVCSLSFSPDGKLLAAGGADGAVRIWCPARREEIRRIEVPGGRIGQVAFASDGRHVLAYEANARTLRILDALEGTPVSAVSDVVDSLFAFSPAPRASEAAAGIGNSCSILELPSGRTLRKLGGDEGPAVASAFFSRDGRRVAVLQKGVKIYDAAGGAPLAAMPLEAGQFCSAAFSPGGRRMAAVDTAGILRVWDARDGKLLHALRGHVGQVDAVAWSPEGRWVATGGRDGTLRFWDLRRGGEARKIDAHDGIVYAVAFDPRGRAVFTGGSDGKLKVWGAPLSAPAGAAEEGSRASGYIGITGEDGPDGAGVTVTSVMEGTAAERYGLEEGDLILEFDGAKVDSFAHLAAEVRKRREGQSVKLKFRRAGEEKELQIKLGPRPGE